MSMDRKNKKAAQISGQQTATQSGSQNDGQRDSKSKRGRGPVGVNGQKERDRHHDSRHERTPSKTTSNLTATAPVPSSAPSPKISPSPDTNTDSIAPTDGPTPSEPVEVDRTILQNDPESGTAPSPARPTVSKRFSSGRNGSSDLGYGPIGSPPNAPMRTPFNNNPGLNQFGPSTSPPANQILPSTSPFAPGEGKQHFFGGYARAVTGGERAAQSPIAIQRGAWRSQIPERSENAVESDEDEMGEDLLPSSLNELLTPEERQRRLSRSGGARVPGFIGEGSVGNIGLMGVGVGSVGTMGVGNHRYSRSVPAARLLEAATVWKETDRDPTNLSTASFSFRSATNLGSEGFSPTQMQLATSNASGAFLHGYARNAIPRSANPQLGRNTVSHSLEETDVLGVVPTIAARGGSRYESPYSIQAANRALQLGSDALSPSSRALQAHAPGQSLPQGLAAGLSRLHLTSSGAQQHLGTKHTGSSAAAAAAAMGMSMGMGMGYGGGSGTAAAESAGGGGLRANVRSPLRSQFLAPGDLMTAEADYMPYGSGAGLGLGGFSGGLSLSPGGIGAMRTTTATTMASWKLPQSTTTSSLEASLSSRDPLSNAIAAPVPHKAAHEEPEMFGMDI
ncbi:hypothetical protein FRC17_009254 [Serendipita sp. 399]|nr:hypothetical protein FRC17_009254 [Serendipita sp. 399]